MKIKRKLLYSVVVLGIAIIIAAAFASCKKADTTSARGVENNSAAEISISENSEVSIPILPERAEGKSSSESEPEHSESETPSSESKTEQPKAASAAKFESGSLKMNDKVSMNYWLFTPENAAEGMPLIIYLHGGSGKGDDIALLTENGFCEGVYNGEFDDVPAYILFPQLSSSYKGWSDAKRYVKQMIEFTVSKYGIDENRISLTGHSMGGTGTFTVAAAYPELFFRIAPMSGSIACTDENISALKNIPIWAFVGSEDKLVLPESSEKFISALNENGGSGKITILDGATHFDVPGLTYFDRETDVIGWLLGNS